MSSAALTTGSRRLRHVNESLTTPSLPTRAAHEDQDVVDQELQRDGRGEWSVPPELGDRRQLVAHVRRSLGRGESFVG